MNIQLNPEQLRELQLAELDGLKFFDDFCRNNGLTYYMCGGCLIGSIRTKGFVPWDDDIDVLMPRPDYEQFLKLYKEKNPSERFVLLDGTKEATYGNIFAVLMDTNHTMVKEYQQNMDMPHGIPLDIFPIDGLASGKIGRIMQYVWTMIYSLFRSGIVPKNQGGLLSFGSKILLGIFRRKGIRYKIWKFAEKRMSCHSFETADNVAELCAGFYFMKKVYPRSIYDGVTEVEFEGRNYLAMKNYDDYLKIPFGNYMKLPPEDERVAHHDIISLELNKISR
ncbi:MAG: 2-C-methyl-D-erythritol 4-phosphate cytidylyltransferase [Ruminococcaceae bacterium]|nr:2-C-methyl-D-erythritol 4-phosphate cytidylyltransferase [Oscillospiraceae bacterium]